MMFAASRYSASVKSSHTTSPLMSNLFTDHPVIYQYVYCVDNENAVTAWTFTTKWIGPTIIVGNVADNSNLTVTCAG